MTVNGLTAIVSRIGLHKSQLRHGGNVTVRRNAEVEQNWTNLDDD